MRNQQAFYRGGMHTEARSRRDLVLPVPLGGWSNDDLPAIVGDDDFSVEIADGSLLIKPLPTLLHVLIQRRLADQLRPQCPPGWEPGVEVPIRIDSGRRVADVAVVRSVPSSPLGSHNYEPEDVAVVIEVVSPSSRRTDRQAKFEDYEHVGIPVYLRIDPEPGLVAHAALLTGTGKTYSTVLNARGGSITLPGETAFVVDLDALIGPG